MTNIEGFKWTSGYPGTFGFFSGYKVIQLVGGSVFLQRVDDDLMPVETLPGLFSSAAEALSSVGVCWRCGGSVVPGAFTDDDFPCPVIRLG